ncbi:MAG: hypothetical protein IPL26_20950 [Leptospiraceae bacterium]|nr:hypothetical protein [Leptospiraceae bacterium]
MIKEIFLDLILELFTCTGNANRKFILEFTGQNSIPDSIFLSRYAKFNQQSFISFNVK